MEKTINKLTRNIKNLIERNRYIFRWYLMYINNKSHEYKNIRLKYNPADINDTYYQKIKNSGEQELEHQIGRLNNYRKIIAQVPSLEGDLVEFGTWRGFSLLWIAYFLERVAIFNKKIIGIDGFVGLPYSDGVFKVGGFSDTSYRLCKNNLMNSKEIYPETKKNISIGQYLYQDKQGISQYLSQLKIKKFCFVHIDCDVTQSFKEIMNIIKEKHLLASECYLLFDDYGCNTDLKEAVNKEFKILSKKWQITTHSSTRFTRNFHFVSKVNHKHEIYKKK